MKATKDSVDASQKITDRITALQTAINSRDYDGYLACFDDSASMQTSYTKSAFETEYPSGTTYAFGTLVIVDKTATCDSTKFHDRDKFL